MARKIIATFLFTLLLASCVGSKSFKGKIQSIQKDVIAMDCAQELNKSNFIEREDIGYACQVKITVDTKFSNENGDSISIEDFTEEASIRVILEDSQIISKSLLIPYFYMT
ncbi:MULTISPECIES: hypothetical protein [unclassified Bacillus (in: firmicutes)]|uniref:hypothetical protein n=1 Tax=unclassified Bacillus (in: firmicutes) TaxID=185979 RepID=UPI0008F3990A|nr:MULTISPECIES: hypothetical protein [unclassified Bacillus (in: firmicutes)]SFA71377.1 hypothetical protein SAMN02799634_101205 [Bacillus sp. UNCCL13]SFQ61562.1 hypothetical protein SAMN04488577_0487 [Bacillus sp. cl95]